MCPAGRDFDWSPTGTQLIYVQEGIWAVDDDGRNARLLLSVGADFYP